MELTSSTLKWTGLANRISIEIVTIIISTEKKGSQSNANCPNSDQRDTVSNVSNAHFTKDRDLVKDYLGWLLDWIGLVAVCLRGGSNVIPTPPTAKDRSTVILDPFATLIRPCRFRFPRAPSLDCRWLPLVLAALELEHGSLEPTMAA